MAETTTDTEIRARILRAFARRARTDGIRSVRMNELARDLGISTRRIYEVFESKEALVRGLLAHWVESRREREDTFLADIEDPAERLKRGARDLLERRSQLSPAFWRELERDHPDAYGLFEAQADRLRRRTVDWLARRVRPELPARLAASVLVDLLLEPAMRVEQPLPEGMRREELIDTAVDIWCRGALAPGKRKKSR